MHSNFVYLASASPRRRALLEQLGVPFEVRVTSADERACPGEAPERYVLRVSRDKAQAARGQLSGQSVEAPILAADTTVVLEGDILGKPVDEAEARLMLARLSGRIHQVFTGVTLLHGDTVRTALGAAEVRFRVISETECRAYCATGEPFDKAGGYGIQGRGAVFVEQISGSYTAVVGLPLFETAELLREIGLPAWLCQA